MCLQDADACEHVLEVEEEDFCFEEDSDPSDNSATSCFLLHSSSCEFTSLACDEELAADCPTPLWEQPQSRPHQQQKKQQQASPLLSPEHGHTQQGGSEVLHERPTSARALLSSQQQDARLAQLSNENIRQQEVRPSPDYLQRHGITEHHRGVAVGWLVEVTEACSLHAATLFQAVSYMDRFFSVAKDVMPGMLQLVATAALSIAAKNTEVMQPTSDEWVAIADNSFTVKDLVHMEFLILHYLGWRVRTPTAHTFLQLMGSALQPGATEFKVAGQLTELALLDFGALRYTYATIAAAALVAAYHRCGTSCPPLQQLQQLQRPATAAATPVGNSCNTQQQLALFLDEQEVQACAALLLRLQAECAAPALCVGMEHYTVLQRRHGRGAGDGRQV